MLAQQPIKESILEGLQKNSAGLTHVGLFLALSHSGCEAFCFLALAWVCLAGMPHHGCHMKASYSGGGALSGAPAMGIDPTLPKKEALQALDIVQYTTWVFTGTYTKNQCRKVSISEVQKSQ